MYDQVSLVAPSGGHLMLMPYDIQSLTNVAFIKSYKITLKKLPNEFLIHTKVSSEPPYRACILELQFCIQNQCLDVIAGWQVKIFQIFQLFST